MKRRHLAATLRPDDPARTFTRRSSVASAARTRCGLRVHPFYVPSIEYATCARCRAWARRVLA